MPDPSFQGDAVLTNDPAAVEIARAVCEPGWLSRAAVLKQTGSVSVRAGEVRIKSVFRGDVVAKSMTLARAKDRVSMMLGSTRLMRQWRGAEMLARAGLTSATPIVLFRGKSAQGATVETLVMERAGLNGGDGAQTLLHHLAGGGLSARDEHEIARALGEDLRAMFDAGLWNRDHKPSNIVASRVSGGVGGWRLVYIDTAGVREARKHKVKPERIARTLASMILEPTGVGHAPRRGVMMRVLKTLHQSTATPKLNRWRDWRAVTDIVRVHGDPTPKDDPLA